MRQRLLLLLAATTLVAACSGSDDGGSSSPTGAPNSAGSTVGSDAPVVTDAETTTTLAPAVLRPAGAQLPPDDQAVTIPDGSAIAEQDGTFAVFNTRPNGVQQCPNGTPNDASCTREQTDPWVSIGTPGGTFTDVQVDSAGTVANPGGFGVNTGIVVSAATDGPNGWVAVGAASFWDSLNYYDTTRRGFIWHSTDGASWQRIDVRDVVGDTSVVMTSVTTTATGYVAVGDIAQPDLSAGPSRGFVLTSPDGITWTKAAELPRQWAVSTRQVIAGDSRIVVHGVEYVCDATAGAMNSFSVGAQFRAWASDDGGVTFTEVPLAGGAITDPLPPPTDPATCPDMFSENDNYKSGAGKVALVGDRLVVVSADGGSVAVTDDLSTWTLGELPDAIPALDPAIYTLKPNTVTAAYGDDEGLVVVELQALRRSDGRQVDAARQLWSWRSTDDGATWERQPLARPTTLAADEIGSLGHTPDSGFFYLGRVDGQLLLRPVTASELVPWGECELVAGADCRFVEIDGLDAAGLDLTGIDLTGASLLNVDFTGTNLTGAQLGGTE
ncbi:MAG: pentapeptide repeat-containing protein, partial [Ilumatobacteraceae bacterium]